MSIYVPPNLIKNRSVCLTLDDKGELEDGVKPIPFFVNSFYRLRLPVDWIPSW